MISFISKGSFNNTESFLQKMGRQNLRSILEANGQRGVEALRSATPVDTGLTAESWNYEIVEGRNSFSIIWTNSDTEDGFPVAIRLQYGYGTGTGGYVQGRDFINGAMRPIFEQIAADFWREVTSA